MDHTDGMAEGFEDARQGEIAELYREFNRIVSRILAPTFLLMLAMMYLVFWLYQFSGWWVVPTIFVALLAEGAFMFVAIMCLEALNKVSIKINKLKDSPPAQTSTRRS